MFNSRKVLLITGLVYLLISWHGSGKSLGGEASSILCTPQYKNNCINPTNVSTKETGYRLHDIWIFVGKLTQSRDKKFKVARVEIFEVHQPYIASYPGKITSKTIFLRDTSPLLRKINSLSTEYYTTENVTFIYRVSSIKLFNETKQIAIAQTKE